MDNIITLYQQRLNLLDANFSRVDHDDAMVAVVYKVTLSQGTQLILKICPRAQDYFREIYFLKHFSGILPVARILKVVPPQTDIDGAILMECIPGSLLNMADLTESLAYEIGSMLARIHLHSTTGYGDLTQPKDLSPDPAFYFTSKFEEGIAECCDHLPIELIKKYRQYFDRHVNLFTAMDGPCIIHRDFRSGNLLVNSDKLEGIIDWASGRASFAEEDFCFLERDKWPTDPLIKKSFLAGYAHIRPVPDYTTIMPLLLLNKAIATIGFTVKNGTWDNSNARQYQINRQFLETFF